MNNNICALNKELYYGTVIYDNNKEFPIFLLKVKDSFVDIYGHKIYKFSKEKNTWTSDDLFLKNIQKYDTYLANKNIEKTQKRI